MAAYHAYVTAWQARIFEHFPDWRTDGAHGISQCNHCGHPGIRWVAVVEHVPTGDKLAFGEICADRVELSGRDAFRAKFIKDAAAKQEAMFARMIAEAGFEAANDELVTWLDSLSSDYDAKTHPFLLDMKRTLASKGSLSEAQVAASLKFMASAKAREAAREEKTQALVDVAPLAEGRRPITGRVVSTKWQASDFGETLKMLVEEEDGNRVWGTVPEALQARGELKDAIVTLTATVTRSGNDEHFGFYKRPTGAEILTPAA